MKRKSLVVLCLVAFSSLGWGQSARFGSNGSKGWWGVDGTSGASGSDKEFTFTGAPVVVDVSGKDATPGANALDGTAASSCVQPQNVRSNLVGAAGGSGGQGGIGGSGGNGGHVDIILKSKGDLANLGVVTIRNAGGSGAASGIGGYGAPGCGCQLTRWSAFDCRWKLYSKAVGVPDALWTFQQSAETACTGDFVGDSRFPPQLPRDNSGRYVYEWRLDQEIRTDYTCEDGASGRRGVSPADGRDGDYGEVTLQVGATRSTNPSTSSALSDIVGKTITLGGYQTKRQSGLRSLLSSASDTSDSYFLSEYGEGSFRIEWKAGVPLASSGYADVEVSAYASGAPKSNIQVDLPVKLFSVRSEVNGTTVIEIKRILGSDDPVLIQECSAWNGKGSLLCTRTNKCIYDVNDGACFPK